MEYIDPKKWAETWKKAGKTLEAIRREELRRADNNEILKNLLPAFMML
ncbi:MAG: hypothetical protein LBE20_06660 [Deltaproteobacteria bacterium]|jgi:hypothetical protein|nr:hypothetical protein [Deltaproteobacteria bacterium]